MSETVRPREIPSRVFRGTLWFLSFRLFSRIVGFLAIAVKARVLTPDDFGLIGSIALVSGLVGIVGAHGVFDQLVRMETLSREDLDRGWTLNLIFSAAVTLVTLLAARPAAALLNEPLLVDALRVTAVRSVLGAFGSPVGVWWSRELRFDRAVQFGMATRVIDAVLTTLGAVVWRSYWGIIWGGMAALIVNIALSHVIRPYWPRLRLDRSASLLAFSGWSLLHGVTNYFTMSSDELVVRHGSDRETFGIYHVSRDLARVFVNEAVFPVAGPLLAGLARVRHVGGGWFVSATAKAIGAALLIAAAVGFGLAATATEAIGLTLGARWADAVPVLTIIAIGSAALVVAELHRSVMVAYGRVEVSALLWLGRAIAQLAACAVAFPIGGPIAVAWAFSATCALFLLFDYTVVFRTIGGAPASILRLLARPLLAGGAMFAVLALLPWPSDMPLLVLAVAKIVLGAATYGLVLALAWRAAGRPQGGETVLLDQLPFRLRNAIIRLIGEPVPQPPSPRL